MAFRRKKKGEDSLPPAAAPPPPVHSARRQARRAEASKEIIRDFKIQLKAQQDLLYGVALFFEGIGMLCAGREAVIETYRLQCRNMIQRGSDNVKRAEALLAQAEQDHHKASALERFSFSSGSSDREFEDLAQRATVLVDTYETLFPNRDRSKPFEETETLRLMEAASAAVAVSSP